MTGIGLNMSTIAEDEIATTILLGKKFDLGEVKKISKRIKNSVTTSANDHKRKLIDEKFIYMSDDAAAIQGAGPGDDTKMRIYTHEITKKIRMNNNVVIGCLYTRRQLEKKDGVPQTTPEYPIFKDFDKHLQNCGKTECSMNIITNILDNPLKCQDALNHIIRCANPNCTSKTCFMLKNIIKLNIIKTENGFPADAKEAI